MSIIKNPSLATHGNPKISWAKDHMDVLNELEHSLTPIQPFRDYTIAMSIHMEAKTARLALLLKTLGANVYATGCNTLSTQDDIAASLASSGVEVFAIHGATSDEYQEHLAKVLESKPQLFIDDGGDLFETYLNLPDSQK